MMYLQLAWRYATRRLVNYIAIAALALALAVQIVAMAVLDGMLVDLQKRLRNLGEQVTLRVNAEPPTREQAAAAAEAIRQALPEVTAVTPLVRKLGFIEGGGGAEYVWVHGIDLAAELAHSSLDQHLLTYKPDPANPSWNGGDRPGLFMGEQMANRLGVRPGMEVELFRAIRGDGASVDIRARRFRVSSLFRSGVFEKDLYGVYIPIDQAAEFYLGDDYADAGDRVETMVLWLDDPSRAEALEPEAAQAATASLSQTLGYNPRLTADNWQRRWSETARGMQHENNLMELVLFLNDAASGFCIFAILVTLVGRRIRDVGLLRCIGASRRGVMGVFLLVGLFIGLAGAAAGSALGVFLTGPVTYEQVDDIPRLAGGGAVETPLRLGAQASERRPRIDRYYEKITGNPLYPPRMFGIADSAGLPVVIYPWKLALYVAAAMLVSILASLYPALWAAYREPVKALREE